MERFVCVHGHFYQPPRENAWLETVELQDSAHPYHDWNERITAECYAANAASRIVDGELRIFEIVNNYARMSFNFGPTLLSWIEQSTPEVYEAILRADKESREYFAGHGSATAQVYNHMIMPLANLRDKHTQVIWGIRDFEHRFGRKPEGMWLAETAADLETLDVLAEHGINYTILAPNQAARIRAKSGTHWREVSGNRVDPTTAYECNLPSGRSIALFFYDGPISQAVAFEGLLSSGEKFAKRLLSGFSDKRTWPQLMHIATDGETYGHHHKFGDMALCYALHYIEKQKLAKLTNYGEYLERFPAANQVEIFENSSWSCAHGVERWRGDCGCRAGGRAGWNQLWRGPLRDALDWLRDELIPVFETESAKVLKDGWAARDAYIDVVLDRSPENIKRFLFEHGRGQLSEADRITALKLLEMQRHAMLMYTSCGWFFDEISGIESVQIIQYAARAIQLAKEISKHRLEEEFLARLEQAQSNIVENCDGKCIYEKFVKPGIVSLKEVGAHYAIASLFQPPDERGQIFCYSIESEKRRLHQAGAARLLVEKARVLSTITHESAEFSYAVLHLGDHNLTGGVATFPDEETEDRVESNIAKAFLRADFPETVRGIDKHFSGATYSIKSLFKDQQRQILDSVLQSTLEQAASNLRVVFDTYAPLMNFLTDLSVPQPGVLQSAAKFVLSTDLRKEIESEDIDPNRVRAMLDAARTWQIEIETEELGYSLKQVVTRRAVEWAEDPMNREKMDRLRVILEAAHVLPLQPDLWQAQNRYHNLLRTLYADIVENRRPRVEGTRDWLEQFRTLGRLLMIHVE